MMVVVVGTAVVVVMVLLIIEFTCRIKRNTHILTGFLNHLTCINLPSRVTGGADRLLIRPEVVLCWDRDGIAEEEGEVSLVVLPLEVVPFLSALLALLFLILLVRDVAEKWSVPLAIVLMLNRLPPVAKLLFLLLPRFGLFRAGLLELDEFMSSITTSYTRSFLRADNKGGQIVNCQRRLW